MRIKSLFGTVVGLVFISLISILWRKAERRSREQEFDYQFKYVKESVEAFRLSTGRFPTNLLELASVPDSPFTSWASNIVSGNGVVVIEIRQLSNKCEVKIKQAPSLFAAEMVRDYIIN